MSDCINIFALGLFYLITNISFAMDFLLSKLNFYEIRGSALPCFTSYLSDRRNSLQQIHGTALPCFTSYLSDRKQFTAVNPRYCTVTVYFLFK